LNLMRERHIGRLPVVEENNPHKLIGIITTSDIVGNIWNAEFNIINRRDFRFL